MRDITHKVHVGTWLYNRQLADTGEAQALHKTSSEPQMGIALTTLVLGSHFL